MDTLDLQPLIQCLELNIDELEEALEPLLKHALSETAGKLPLLDKAKFYVLITYAIESVLYSNLKLSGIDAKEHPVFRELTRVKQYFEKIKVAENGGTKRENLTLDKQAAGRIIKHALAGNSRIEFNDVRSQDDARGVKGATGEGRVGSRSKTDKSKTKNHTGKATGNSHGAASNSSKPSEPSSSVRTKKRSSAGAVRDGGHAESKKMKQ